MKEVIDLLDFIKVENFFFTKDTVRRKRRHRLGEIFAKHAYYKGLLPKIYKELLKFGNKKINNPIKNGPKTLIYLYQRRYTDG